MSKTEVYSWRVDPALKRELEAAARADGRSLAHLLNQISRDWLRRERPITATDRQGILDISLNIIIEGANDESDGGPPVKSATNAVVREAFAEKLIQDRERRGGPR